MQGIIQHAAIAVAIGILYLIPAILTQQHLHHLHFTSITAANYYLKLHEFTIFGLIGVVSITTIVIYLALYDPALFKRRLQFIGQGESRSSQRWILRLSGVGAILLIVVAAVERQTEFSGKVSSLIVAVGDIGVFISFVLIFLTFRCNTYASSTIEVTKGQELIDTSVYGITRHPMYTAGCLLMLSTPLALAAPTTLIFTPFLIYTMMLRLQDEEEMLQRDLKGYKGYMRRVQWRLMPYVY